MAVLEHETGDFPFHLEIKLPTLALVGNRATQTYFPLFVTADFLSKVVYLVCYELRTTNYYSIVYIELVLIDRTVMSAEPPNWP